MGKPDTRWAAKGELKIGAKLSISREIPLYIVFV